MIRLCIYTVWSWPSLAVFRIIDYLRKHQWSVKIRWDYAGTQDGLNLWIARHAQRHCFAWCDSNDLPDCIEHTIAISHVMRVIYYLYSASKTMLAAQFYFQYEKCHYKADRMFVFKLYSGQVRLGKLTMPGLHCLFVLRFYGPVNPVGSCRARSICLTTRLLGRLNPLSG